MLERIDKREIMTTREAMEKYWAKYFMMIFTETVDGCDNDLGYVFYTADNQKELAEVPKEEYLHLPFGLMIGDAAEPFPTIGGIVHYD